MDKTKQENIDSSLDLNNKETRRIIRKERKRLAAAASIKHWLEEQDRLARIWEGLGGTDGNCSRRIPNDL